MPRDFDLEISERLGDDVVTEVLRCGVRRRVPHRRGGAADPARGLGSRQQASANAFGYEWTRFRELRPEYREQFLGWIARSPRRILAAKVVLDAGCGKGGTCTGQPNLAHATSSALTWGQLSRVAARDHQGVRQRQRHPS